MRSACRRRRRRRRHRRLRSPFQREWQRCDEAVRRARRLQEPAAFEAAVELLQPFVTGRGAARALGSQDARGTEGEDRCTVSFECNA